jgi:hypothetical protein
VDPATLTGSRSQSRPKLIPMTSWAAEISVWVRPALTRSGVAESDRYPGSLRTASALPAQSVQMVATMRSTGTRVDPAAASITRP